MGVDVRLEDEGGEAVAVVEDAGRLLAGLVAGAAGPACLRFIDPYGDTMFNGLQMAALIPELEAAVAGVGDGAVREFGRAVLRLARRCRGGGHLYLKFVGD